MVVLIAAEGPGPPNHPNHPNGPSPPSRDPEPSLSAGTVAIARLSADKAATGRSPFDGDGDSDSDSDGASRAWTLPFPLDLRLTLSVHRRGGRDPAYLTDASGAVWRTSLTPDGPGTLRVAARPAPAPAPAPGRPASAEPGPAPARPAPASAAGTASPPAATLVTAQAWGPGAGWLLDRVPALVGALDDRSGFVARHPVLSDIALRFPDLRIGRSGRLFEALVPAVLEQKVVGTEARRAWRYLLSKFGTPAPGPAPDGMRVCPPPRVWARIPSWDWHRAGVEGIRARTIIGAAEVAGRLEQALDQALEQALEQAPELDATELDRRLRLLPGIGVWTSAEIRQRAAGDPDAVSVGDYHLPNAVGWTLAQRRTDDAGMLELLAPYAGHRYRAARLIELGGSRPPRHGPRMSTRDYRGL